MQITSEAQLREIYGFPNPRARDKVMPGIDKHAHYFIERSPFLILATCSADGKMDASPRGGDPGFVKISENGELLLPDSKGNNRIDSLVNIVETKKVGLILMIPGIDETLRVNGTAQITTDAKVLNTLETTLRPPISCIVVEPKEVFLHCAKAFMRSKLWKAESQLDPKEFPSIGAMLKDQLNSKEEAEKREDMLRRYKADL